MVRLTRLAAFPILFLLCYGMASAQPPAPPGPLRWETYLSKDSKELVPQPEWVEAPLNGKLWLKIGQAIYTPPKGYSPTKAKLWVRKAGPQPNTWIDPPALILDAKVKLVGGDNNLHSFLVKDEDNPPTGFDKNSTVQLQFRVDLKNAADNTIAPILLPPETRVIVEK